MAVSIDDVRALAAGLPRSYEVFVHGRVKFRVGQIVYLAFSRDETLTPAEIAAARATAIKNVTGSTAATPRRYDHAAVGRSRIAGTSSRQQQQKRRWRRLWRR
jgi:hypothetical protein